MTVDTLEANEWLSEPCRVPWSDTELEFIMGSLETKHPNKCTCQGTGNRHAWAWERCSTKIQVVPSQSYTWSCRGVSSFDGPNCERCDGSGFVLAVTLEKALGALRRIGGVELVIYMDGSCIVTVDGVNKGSHTSDLEAAALDALKKVKMA